MEEIKIEEMLNPKSKLLLLISKIIEEEEGEIEKEDLIDLLLESDSSLSVTRNYKDRHSAKLSIQHHLEQLEKDGIIETFHDETGTEYVKMKKHLPSLSLIKLDKVFSNNVIVANIIVCMILFAYAMYIYAVTYDLTLAIITGISLFMSLLSFFTYRTKLLF